MRTWCLSLHADLNAARNTAAESRDVCGSAEPQPSASLTNAVPPTPLHPYEDASWFTEPFDRTARLKTAFYRCQPPAGHPRLAPPPGGSGSLAGGVVVSGQRRPRLTACDCRIALQSSGGQRHAPYR